jgi:hypothetical protein
MTSIKPIQPNTAALYKPKVYFASVQSHLAAQLKADPNSTRIYSATSAANLPVTLSNWNAGRPNAEYTATTGTVEGQATTAVIKLSLKKGATYNFVAAYTYSYSGAKPSVGLQITDANGKSVASAKGNAMSWTATADGDYSITMSITAAKGGTAAFTSYKLDATQTLSKLPVTSGDKNIDAVLAGGSYWWHPIGSLAQKSLVNVSDNIKQLNGASNTIYYGFLEGTESYLSSKDLSGFTKMDDGQKTAVKTAFDYLSTLINVEFKLDETKADIEFGTNSQSTSAGYASFPLGNGGNPSVLMLDNSDNPGNSGENLASAGSYGWETLIHEMGHAMGLKHPGAYDAGGGKAPPPYLSSATDNRAMSIMSYNDPIASQLLNISGNQTSYTYSLTPSNPSTYQTYDLAALQYLYGAKKSTLASDVSMDDQYSQFRTLWAPQVGGVVLNAAATTRANLFELRQGGYSSISMRSTDAEKITEIKEKFLKLNLSDAAATSEASKLYSNLKAAKNSKKIALNNLLYNGKNNLALSYGSSFSSVIGGAARDKFYVGNYSALINGGGGSDTVYLMGTAKDWTIDANKTKATSKSGITITMQSIEAVAFYKATEALVHA